jgi:hypothetical protein
MAAQTESELTKTLDNARGRLDYAATLGMMSVGSVQELSDGPAAMAAIADGLTMVEDAMLAEEEHLVEIAHGFATKRKWTLDAAYEPPAPAAMVRAAKMVVEQTTFGPLAFDGISRAKRKGLDDGRWGGPLMTLLYWCDGERTLADAMQLAGQELGRDLSGLLPQVLKLEKLGLVKIRRA